MRVPAIGVSLLLVVAMQAPLAQATTREVKTVESAVSVLDEIMSIPASSIPAYMLADAEGLAIIPGVLKGGFLLGARRGRGVVLARDERGHWQPPVFITLTGGSIGWQAGVQSTDVILVFRTRKSVEGTMDGKLTIGADAAVAAGPLGRKAAAATDGRLKAEIYSYCRSRGLFAGVSIDGSVLQVDRGANASLYRPARPGGPVRVHPSVLKLLGRVAHYTQSGTTRPHDGAEVVPAPAVPGMPAGAADERGADRLEATRRQLAAASLELSPLVDRRWNRYLALPAEVFEDGEHPSVSAVAAALQRYGPVSRNPAYRTLSVSGEFRTVHELLRQYLRLLESRQPRRLNLPPPPADALPQPALPQR